MTVVFHNGTVFTGTRATSDSVAVSDGHIVATGTDADVRAAVTGATETIDLEGRMLVSGFQDAHIHPAMGGDMRLQCNLEDAANLDEALVLIKSFVASHPGNAWIEGGGWRYPWFDGGNPSRELLDAITDTPVYLVVADGHSGWANSSALVLAGINAESADPADGVVVRDDQGVPQGTLHEGAMRLVEDVLPAKPAGYVKQCILESQEYLLSLGITTWQDAWVTDEIHRAYRDMVAEGSLTVAVRGALWWDRTRDASQLAELIDQSEEGVGRYDPRSIKLMLDGVCENFTASMLHPYRDQHGHATENVGLDFIGRDVLMEVVPSIDAAGLQPHFHALGDRAVRNALDAVGEARRVNGPSDSRPHLAHIQVVDPADVPRFAELGAVANAQPLWAVEDASMTELTLPFLAEGRAQHQYPFRSLLDANATMAMGSDWSVSTPDVMAQVAIAVNRSAPGLAPFLAEQRLSVGEALTAFTAGSAYVNHRDDVSGTIEVGKEADLVVLSADPMAESDLHSIQVDMTVVGGNIVYQRQAA